MVVSTPASASRSSAWSIRALPWTSIRGLGAVAVNGRMRRPSPAASNMARRGAEASAVRMTGPRSNSGGGVGRPGRMGQVLSIPSGERRAYRVPQASPKIVNDSRQMHEILRLVVAPLQTAEDAEDLGGALRAQDGVAPAEAGRVEIRCLGGAERQVAGQED